jgi:hypothetical protein
VIPKFQTNGAEMGEKLLSETDNYGFAAHRGNPKTEQPGG